MLERALLTITMTTFLFAPAAPAQDEEAVHHRKEILVTTGQGEQRCLCILDHNGDSVTGRIFKVPLSNSERWEYDGKIRYTYFLKDSTAFVNKNKPGVAGHFYVTDANLNDIREFALLPHGDV